MASTPLSQRILFFSDGPPILGGQGGHTHGARIIEVMDDHCVGVLTHKFHASIDESAVRRGQKCPVLFHRDFSRFGSAHKFPIIRAVLDSIAIIWDRKAIQDFIKTTRPDRIFAFSGADWRFLLRVAIVAKFSKIPVDLHVVDDFEESARAAGGILTPFLARMVERFTYKCVDRVLPICPGYIDHLKEKYGVSGEVLYPPIEQLPAVAQSDGVIRRELGYLGSINHLYLDTLDEILAAVQKLNVVPGADPLRVVFYTLRIPKPIFDRFKKYDFVRWVEGLDNHQLHKALSTSLGLLLPYSFDAKHRVMVSTSFSHKFTEYLPAGRPILVVGPEYASTPRLFAEHNLPVLCTDTQQIPAVIQQLTSIEPTDVETRYRQLLADVFSKETLRKVIIPGG